MHVVSPAISGNWLLCFSSSTVLRHIRWIPPLLSRNLMTLLIHPHYDQHWVWDVTLCLCLCLLMFFFINMDVRVACILINLTGHEVNNHVSFQ